MKLSSNYVDVLNVYRSSGTNDQDLVNELTQIISQEKVTVVCGDFNHCFKTEKGNVVSKKFVSTCLAKHPTTTLSGRSIDFITFPPLMNILKSRQNCATSSVLLVDISLGEGRAPFGL